MDRMNVISFMTKNNNDNFQCVEVVGVNYRYYVNGNFSFSMFRVLPGVCLWVVCARAGFNYIMLTLFLGNICIFIISCLRFIMHSQYHGRWLYGIQGICSLGSDIVIMEYSGFSTTWVNCTAQNPTCAKTAFVWCLATGELCKLSESAETSINRPRLFFHLFFY